VPGSGRLKQAGKIPVIDGPVEQTMVRIPTDPSIAVKERETPVIQALLPKWMQADRYGRRGVGAFKINGEGVITSGRRAGPIGSGGNYIQPGAGAALFLIKEGGVNLPKRVGPKGARYLSFSTNGKGNGSDRVEYAPTYYGFSSSGHYRFDTAYQVTFDLRIPAKSAITNKAYYLMQWWQTSPLPPVAGVRLKRGTSHTLEFVTRGPGQGSDLEPVPDLITEYALRPGSWHSFAINFRISPTQKGIFDVAIDGQPLGSHVGPIAATPGPSPGGPPDSYRVKFGIYKESESLIFMNHFDNIALTTL
jgi:hypothetical protein